MAGHVQHCCCVWLQFCRRKKVRSSQHSSVQYWYSKCTPITNAREFDETNIADEKIHLQELIRYLDSAKSLNALNDAVNTVESEFDERVETADDNVQEPMEKVDSNLEGGMENGDDDEPLERTENEFQEFENTEDGFQEAVGTTDDNSEEVMEKMEVDIEEPAAREFVDDVEAEDFDVDEPIIMA